MSKPKFERRHYVCVSTLFNATRPLEPDSNLAVKSAYHKWEELVWMFAHMFEADNRGFKIEKYLTECGYDVEAMKKEFTKEAAE